MLMLAVFDANRDNYEKIKLFHAITYGMHNHTRNKLDSKIIYSN